MLNLYLEDKKIIIILNFEKSLSNSKNLKRQPHQGCDKGKYSLQKRTLTAKFIIRYIFYL